MNSIIKDLKFALRGLVKHPAFFAIAVVTLALGIGGSTSIFTVVDAALLRGLLVAQVGSLKGAILAAEYLTDPPTTSP